MQSAYKYLREYGCDYLKNLSLWDSMTSYEGWKADARSNNSTVKTPYWLGRNLCVRGRGHKPLSLYLAAAPQKPKKKIPLPLYYP